MVSFLLMAGALGIAYLIGRAILANSEPQIPSGERDDPRHNS